MHKKNNYTDDEILQGIRDKNEHVHSYLIKECKPFLRLFVLRRGGNGDDANDVYQDSILELIEKAEDPHFKPRCKITTMFLAIAKHRWYNMHRRRKREVSFKVPVHESAVDFPFPDNHDLDIYKQLFWSVFKNLPPTCKTILILTWRDHTNNEIAEITKNTEAYIRKRKSTCTKRFTAMVKNHKNYHLLTQLPDVTNYKQIYND